MWSLPDIDRLNAEAASKAQAATEKPEEETVKPEDVECAHCCDNHCGDLKEPLFIDKNNDMFSDSVPPYYDPYENSGYIQPYYDIFSEDIKGWTGICAKCKDDHHIDEDDYYFTCDHCERLMISNYTWEPYYAIVNDCERVCLNCYCDMVIEDADEEYWIDLSDESIESFKYDNIRHAPHCIAVKMPIPKSIEYVDNVEADSMSGGPLYGTGSTECQQESTAESVREVLRQAKDDGAKRALVVIDAVYQFAVSIGVYIDSTEQETDGL